MDDASRIERFLAHALEARKGPGPRRDCRQRCTTRCFPAAPGSARACASRSPAPAVPVRPATGRGRGDRDVALRLARARRPAVLRRCGHAARTARGAPQIRRAARGAGGRCADRARVPDSHARTRLPGRPATALLGTVAAAVGLPRGIVAGQAWECEPGSRCRNTSAQDRRAVRGRDRCRRAGRRRRPVPWRGRRLHWRGLSGGRRHPRRDRRRELGKPTGRDAALDGPTRRCAVGLPAPCATWRSWRRRRLARYRTVRGRRNCEPDVCGRAVWRRGDGAGSGVIWPWPASRPPGLPPRRPAWTGCPRRATGCWRAPVSSAGRRLCADPPGRPAPRAGPVRLVRRLHLFPGAARLRATAAVRGAARRPRLGRDDIAARLGLRPDAADRLLGAALALGLLARRPGGCFGIGPLGAALVGNPAAPQSWHHAMLYADLGDPVPLLRDGRSRQNVAPLLGICAPEVPAALQLRRSLDTPR